MGGVHMCYEHECVDCVVHGTCMWLCGTYPCIDGCITNISPNTSPNTSPQAARDIASVISASANRVYLNADALLLNLVCV